MELREKVIEKLEKAMMLSEAANECKVTLGYGVVEDILALLKALYAFKSYFDDLYGTGLGVANWHMNGEMEPFDNFYESAIEEYENAQNG